MRVALVCSWLNQYGGAERVIEAVHEMWPEAPIYTSIHDPGAMPDAWRRWDIRPSWMNRLPGVNRRHQLYLPLYPFAFETMTLPGYDLVLSISSGFATGVRVPHGLHLSYCLTPPRFLWGYQDYLEREPMAAWQRALLPPVLAGLRAWDHRTARRVDHFLTTAIEVQRRIRDIYGRSATIIHPPVDTDRFQIGDGPGDYLLVVGRLVPYRRIDLAVAACNQLELPLKIVGQGRAREGLEALAGPTVEFLGWRSDEETARLIEGCRALIFPGLEDFGITPLEAQAAGRPVVAYAAGGSLETVVDGETGVLFPEQTVDSLAAALTDLEDRRFDPEVLRRHALRFDKRLFQERLDEQVRGLLAGAVTAD